MTLLSVGLFDLSCGSLDGLLGLCLNLLGSSSLLSSLLGSLLGNRLGNDLDDDHLGVIALTTAKLHDARVTAVTVGPHALSGLVKELSHKLLIAKLGDSKTTRVQVALLGPRDDRLSERAQGLGAGLGGLDAIVLEESLSGLFFMALVWLASVPSLRPFLTL